MPLTREGALEVAQELGERLREGRRRAGLRQEQVAEAIGSHPVTVSKYERGVQDPSTELLSAMARLYQVSLDWLLGNDQPAVDPDYEADLELVMNEASLALRQVSDRLSPAAIKSIADYIRFVDQQERAESEGEG